MSRLSRLKNSALVGMTASISCARALNNTHLSFKAWRYLGMNANGEKLRRPAKRNYLLLLQEGHSGNFTIECYVGRMTRFDLAVIGVGTYLHTHRDLQGLGLRWFSLEPFALVFAMIRHAKITSSEPRKAAMRSSKVTFRSPSAKSILNSLNSSPPITAPPMPIKRFVQRPKPSFFNVTARPASVPAKPPTMIHMMIWPMFMTWMLRCELFKRGCRRRSPHREAKKLWLQRTEYRRSRQLQTGLSVRRWKGKLAGRGPLDFI